MNLVEIVAEVFRIGWIRFYRFDQADSAYWPHRRSVRRESIRAGEGGGIYTWCRNFIGIMIGFILSKIAAWGVLVFILVCNQGL